MCTLLIWKHAHPRFALIVAANRDEDRNRAAEPPQRLCDNPVVAGGRDLAAGGTWLAVSERGFVTAITNRRDAGAHDPSKRSRGLLALEIASAPSYLRARAALAAIDPAAYNPFVLCIGGAREAVALHAGSDGARIVDIGDGAHAVTNWEIDATRSGRPARAAKLAGAFAMNVGEHDDALARRLHALLADHAAGVGGDEALCVHRPQSNYGTRSSSIVLLSERAGATRYYHAEGPPCTSQLMDYSALLRQESESPAANELQV